MTICIDYNGKGIWLAWNKEEKTPVTACGNVHRLLTVAQAKFPQAEIECSDAAQICLQLPDPYVGSELQLSDKMNP